MIRRIARRLRHLAAARRVPLLPLVSEVARLAPTLVVITGTILATLFRSIRRVLAPHEARPLRVGIDIRAYYEPLTGVGWYLFHLLEELGRLPGVELVLFGVAIRFEGEPTLHATLPAGSRLTAFDLRGRQLSRHSNAVTSAAFPLLAWAESCDLFFAPNYFLPRLLSAVATKRVSTIHDLTFRRYPELLQTETLADLEREMTRAIFRADALICVSEATRQDVLEFYRTDPARAITVHSGMGAIASASARSLDLPSRYVLFVSTIEPRKNLGALLTAYEELRDSGEYDGALVIAGKIGWKSSELVRRLGESRWSASIHHLHYLPAADLAQVYERAELFVFPSHYEGFGFPLLEAMARGVPSIAAETSSLPEIGGEAAIYFDPAGRSALLAAMKRVLTDAPLRARLAEAGPVRARDFSWEKCAQETLRVFQSVVERR